MIMRTLAVFTKELRDAGRDRRSLVSVAMYAICAPLAMALALGALARDRTDDGPLEMVIGGAARAPSLVHHLEQHGVRVAVARQSPWTAVRRGAFDVALIVPPDYAERFAGGRTAPLELLYDGASSRSLARAERARRVIAAYGGQVTEARLILRGLSPELAAPVRVHDRDVATTAERAGRLLAMLPVFLLLAPFLGGLAVAVDATAGERDRGSLEALLLHPVRPWVLVGGKWLAAAVVSVATVVVVVVVSALVMELPRVRAIDLPVGLRAGEAAAVIMVLMPLALLAPALQMLLALFAASAREAHTQVSLLTLVPAVPGFLVAFGSMPDASWLAAMPIVAQQLQVADLLSGRAIAPADLAGAAIATTALAMLAVAATTRLLVRERAVQERR